MQPSLESPRMGHPPNKDETFRISTELESSYEGYDSWEESRVISLKCAMASAYQIREWLRR